MIADVKQNMRTAPKIRELDFQQLYAAAFAPLTLIVMNEIFSRGRLSKTVRESNFPWGGVGGGGGEEAGGVGCFWGGGGGGGGGGGLRAERGVVRSGGGPRGWEPRAFGNRGGGLRLEVGRDLGGVAVVFL